MLVYTVMEIFTPIIQSNLPTLILAMFSAIIILLVLIIIALVKIRKINKKGDVFFSGKDGKDLEKFILEQSESIKNLDKDVQELFEASNKIYKLAFRGIHKVGVVRFNPFKDIGGNQSFSIALLDGKNSGLIISSLHTREGTRIYSKPITEGTSKDHTLTEEEKKAVELATPLKDNNQKK